ncbi:eukaryotic translation initiation factor 4 gamma-like isoform X2 [Antennarius striatus]|uniref:eukaryotic translation initiation factor 4 gamma-like isoform X2 n=1 Tax=Antennarius striatus TaxID=241820 RepID=UPI0035B45FD9
MVQQRWLGTCALCLVAMAISGLLTVQPPHQSDQPPVEPHGSTPQTPRIAFFLPMEITNRVFTDALLNPASDDYQSLYEEVSDLLESIYNCSDYNTCPTDVFYGGITAMTFRANTVQPQTLQLNLNFTTKDKITLAIASTPTTINTTTAATATPATPTSVTATTPTAKDTTTTTTATTTTTTATNTLQQTLTTASITTPPHTTTTTSTTSPIQEPASTTRIIHGNQTHGVKKLAVKATTGNLYNKHTDSPRQASDPPPAGDNSNDWIRRWGTAILVLAAANLFLLIVIFIMMFVRWCGKKTENNHTNPFEDSCYFEKKQLPQDPLPAYTPGAPAIQGPGPVPVTAGDVPMKTRIGFYAVNP